MTELLSTLAVVAAYLAVLRAIDLNEREPWWALLHFLVLGTLATLVLHLVVDPAVLVLSVWPGALARAVTIGAAMTLGVAMLAGIERLRGWAELNDVMDGLVYGAATGLGVGVAETLLQQLAEPSIAVAQVTGPPAVFVTNLALAGLIWGLCGAAFGVGAGVALRREGLATRGLALTGGLAATVVLTGIYEITAHGAPLAGWAGILRAWGALLLPLAAATGAAAYALVVERHVIARELQGEVASGVVSTHDLQMLLATGARHTGYARDLLTGRWRRLTRHIALHNRLVQLALVRSALDRPAGRRRRAALEASLGRLRAAVREFPRGV